MYRIVFVVLLSATLFAQDLQNRDIAHLQIDFGHRWFVPVWSITNLRSQTPNNTNLFFGVGIRGNGWWLESMGQRQWNPKGNQWMLDFRYDKQAGRWHFYAEGTPFLTKKAFYEFVIVEAPAWKKWRLGAETENTHQPGPDATALGPRINRSFGRLAGFDVSGAGAFRFDPLQHPSPVTGHPHEIRFYLVFNRRFAPADRK